MSQATFPSGNICGAIGCHNTDDVLCIPVPGKGRRALCGDCRKALPGGDPA